MNSFISTRKINKDICNIIIEYLTISSVSIALGEKSVKRNRNLLRSNFNFFSDFSPSRVKYENSLYKFNRCFICDQILIYTLSQTKNYNKVFEYYNIDTYTCFNCRFIYQKKEKVLNQLKSKLCINNVNVSLNIIS